MLLDGPLRMKAIITTHQNRVIGVGDLGKVSF